MKTSLTEFIAICLHKIGIKPNVTTFIDENTLMYGYGKLDGQIGVWKFNLPSKYAKKYYPQNTKEFMT